MNFLTREFFDWLIIGVIAVGLILAALRLRADLTRPLPPQSPFDEDTQPVEPQNDEPSGMGERQEPGKD
jgi:hypothetical protein